MDISNLITELTKAYESDHDIVKAFIDRGQLNFSPDNKEPDLAELIMAGKLGLERVEEIIDLYHIKAINNLLENSESNDSNISSKTIYIKKAGTIWDCVKSINLNDIDELIIIGKINHEDLYRIFDICNDNYKIKKLDLTNTIIESCTIYGWDYATGTETERYCYKNTIYVGGDKPYLKSISFPKFITNIEIGGWVMYHHAIEAIHVSKENLFYSSEDGVLYNKKRTKIICFPKHKKDISFLIPKSVLSIGVDSFLSCVNLTSVIIPDSVTTIEDGAFCFCESLTDINISDSVISIGNGVFANCNNLTTITLPNSLSKIGNNCFNSCKNLSTINIQPDNNNFIFENGILFDKQKTTLIKYSISKNETIYSIPESVTIIETGAFSKCEKLISITIPSSIKSIKSNAFGDCKSLTNIIIPNTILEIENDTFSGCIGLTNFIIPETVKRIGDSAFAFCSGLINITIPKSVTEIGNNAFYVCSGLIDIKIPETVIKIGNRAFSACSGLKNIKLPESVSEIKDYTFDSCSSLTSLIIPDSVTNIGREAFINCANLENVTIGREVYFIDNQAFGRCNELACIEILNSHPPFIEEDCFSGSSSIKDVFVPTDDAVIAYKANASWIEFFPGDIIKKSISVIEIDQSINNVTLAKHSNVSKIIDYLKKIINL